MMPTVESLKEVRWEVLARTYGNSHATLVGLIVEWWVGRSPSMTVMESGATYKYHKNGKGSRHCDGLLLEKGKALGVLEVEGTCIPATLEKMGHFLTPREENYWQNLQFGIFVAYAYGPKGRGANRHIPERDLDDKKLIGIVQSRSEKPVFLIAVNKLFPPKAKRDPSESERFNHNASEYYYGELLEVLARKVQPGSVGRKITLWSRLGV